jgi:hypothetical protein
MSLSQTLEFITKLSFGNADPLNYASAFVSFSFCFVVLGGLWGKLWNRNWSLGKHLPTAIASGFFALFLAMLVLQWRTTNGALASLAEQRTAALQQIVGSGADNRLILRKAWDKLLPLGGQEGLTPPLLGGNELRINNGAEARILVMAAADSAASQLRIREPFLYGLPLTVRDSSTIASESNYASVAYFPVTVNPANDWVRNGLAAQASFAFDNAARLLNDPLKRLDTLVIAVISSLIALQMTIVATSAFRDIKENP